MANRRPTPRVPCSVGGGSAVAGQDSAPSARHKARACQGTCGGIHGLFISRHSRRVPAFLRLAHELLMATLARLSFLPRLIRGDCALHSDASSTRSPVLRPRSFAPITRFLPLPVGHSTPAAQFPSLRPRTRTALHYFTKPPSHHQLVTSLTII